MGPAVIGILRYRIVLPKWVLDLTDAERDLVLVHEREHATVGDPSLLFAATILVALSPWNVALWWMARRLRFAMELDCDARVLRVRPDRAAYGALLLAVNERTYSGAMPIVALAEPVSLTERRIAAITSLLPRFVLARATGAGFVALVLTAGSCVAPRPTLTFGRPAASVSAASVPSVEQPRAMTEPPTTPKALVVPKSTADTSRALRRETPAPRAIQSRDSASVTRPDSVPSQAPTPTPAMTTSGAGRSDTLPVGGGGGRGLGRGGATDIPGLVDSIFHRLFDDVPIGAEQEKQARDLLTRLETDQVAQSNAAFQALASAMPQRTALQTQRDSALRTLVTSDADRATLDARLASPGTGRRGGPPPANANGGRSAGPGGRSGGDGRGGGGGALDNLVDATYRRLFDGLSITADGEASARAIIGRTQLALQALMPSPGPLQLLLLPTGRVLMQAATASTLAALLATDEQREKLRARINVVALPPQPRP